MSEFMKVVGNDPGSQGRKQVMFVATHHLLEMCPVYAEKGTDGQYYGCTSDHTRAELVTYRLTSIRGDLYFCGNPEELDKLHFAGTYPTGVPDEVLLSQLGRTGFPEKEP